MEKVTTILVILETLVICVAGTSTHIGVRITAEQQHLLMRQQTQYLRLPCDCSGDHCGCCANLGVPLINFNQKGCIQLGYNPEDIALGLDLLLNDRSVYHTELSARNPPPICAGTGVPLLNICARIYDIRVQRQTVRACANLELQFAGRPLIVVSFDCVRVGANGINLEKPTASIVMGIDPIRKLLRNGIMALQNSWKRRTEKLSINGVVSVPITVVTTVDIASNKTHKLDLKTDTQNYEHSTKLLT